MHLAGCVALASTESVSRSVCGACSAILELRGSGFDDRGDRFRLLRTEDQKHLDEGSDLTAFVAVYEGGGSGRVQVTSLPLLGDEAMAAMNMSHLSSRLSLPTFAFSHGGREKESHLASDWMHWFLAVT